MQVKLCIFAGIRMKIIILGTTDVSLALAQALSHEQHDITLIGTDEPRLSQIAQHLDIKIIIDMPSYPHVLRQADADHTDVLIAVTDSDEVNMVSCQIAYSLFNIPTKIARIRTPHYFARHELFSDTHLPIDVFINPDQLVADAVAQTVESPHILQNEGIAQTRCHVGIYRVTAHSPLCGQPISQIAEHHGISIPALRRTRRLHSPTDTLTCKPSDELCLIGNSAQLRTILSHTQHASDSHNNIIISGGQDTGFQLARILAAQRQVKLIEPNTQRCHQLAKLLPKVTVLNGDASDDRLLKEEHIEDTDVFCALTSDDENNILNALQAKHLGARQTIAIIKRNNYLAMLNHRILDIALSPQQIILSGILPYTRPPAIQKTIPLRWPQSEIIAIPAKYYQKLLAVRHPHWKVCGIIREQTWQAQPDITQLEPTDEVVCFIKDTDTLTQLKKKLRI